MIRQKFTFQVMINNDCNLLCKHCYVDKDSRQSIDIDVLIDWILRAIKTVKSDWVDIGHQVDIDVQISGGEPLLNGSLPSVVNCLHGVGCNVYVLSNGTIPIDISQDWVSRVSGFQFSIDGPETVHDEIRGGGTYGSVLFNLKRLLSCGHKAKLNCTVTRKNIDHVKSLFSAMEGFNTQVSVKRYIPKHRNDELVLDVEQFNILKSLISGYGFIISDDPLLNIDNCEKGSIGGCSIGRWGISILSNGNIVPCSKLDIKLGNIVNDSFDIVWYNSEILKLFRDKNSYTTCSKCEKYNFCRGCSAFNFKYCGNLFGKDYYCHYN